MGYNMSEESETPKSKLPSVAIRLPRELWHLLTLDGKRSHRSRNDQVWAILEAYYRLNNVELMSMDAVRQELGFDPSIITKVVPPTRPIEESTSQEKKTNKQKH